MYPAERFQLQDSQRSPRHQKPSAKYHSLHSVIWDPLAVSNLVAGWNVSSFLELFLEWPSHYGAHWKVALWNVGLPCSTLPKPFFGDLLKHLMMFCFFSWGNTLANFAIKKEKKRKWHISFYYARNVFFYWFQRNIARLFKSKVQMLQFVIRQASEREGKKY